MAITGEKFLQFEKKSLIITGHALSRIRDLAGVNLDPATALEMFHAARQVKCEELFALGYRPAIKRRKQKGIKSWYFRTEIEGEEAIAVISTGQESHALLWITTYFKDKQTEEFRKAETDGLGAIGKSKKKDK